MKQKVKAFTLAEVLITLAIIGVVAACTIPTLITNYQKNQTTVKLKKAYTTLSQAILNSTIINGPVKNWNFNDPDFYQKYLANHLKVTEVGKSYHPFGAYKTLNGAKVDNSGSICFGYGSNYAILSDGTYLLFCPVTSGEFYKIGVDINGAKSSKTLGKDAFTFLLTKTSNNIIPYGLQLGTKTRQQLMTSSLSSKVGDCTKTAQKKAYESSCAALIMIDNWQIKEDYPW